MRYRSRNLHIAMSCRLPNHKIKARTPLKTCLLCSIVIDLEIQEFIAIADFISAREIGPLW
jgi:hypothetical protein